MLNIPRYSLENRKVIYFFLFVMLTGGIMAFFQLPKKEDSPFVIKTAVLVTQYPGATPQEVEELVTSPIEREIQSMSDVFQVKSESYFGMSKISIELSPTIPASAMPVKWDELRRKVANVQPRLPIGTSAISVNDDFGDVYGIYYALTATDGFTYAELRHWAQYIRTLLTPLPGVQKVALFGEQTEVVKVNISTSKLASLGLDMSLVSDALRQQNVQTSTGDVFTDVYQVKLRAEGTFNQLDDVANQLIASRDGREIRLGDVAEVVRSYQDPPSTLMRVDGLRAIGIGVASGAGDNVVEVGKEVENTMRSVYERLPIGMELKVIYPEDKIAEAANNGFIFNLIESLGIVLLVIFLVMGVRAGILIGSSLLFSVGGTLLVMLGWDVGLNRTSLAAFIIAMGMLVDNAIVVTDNARIGIRMGKSRYDALVDGATKPQWALLGATLIAVCSFLPLYLAPASVAEIVKPLFVVLAVSLGLSWILALTQTTTFGNFILKETTSDGVIKNPYDNAFYRHFKNVLTWLISRRRSTLSVVFLMLVVSVIALGLMPQSFFPKMDKPYFRADLIFPEGYSIHVVDVHVKRVEEFLKKDSRVKSFSVTLGGTPLRYYLASSSYGPKGNYANVLVETNHASETASVEQAFYEFVSGNFPDAIVRSGLFALSPVPEGAIEIAFVGEDIDVLSQLVEDACHVARSCNLVTDVRSNWGNKVLVWKPSFSAQKGLRLGITRERMAHTLRTATGGFPIGEYREGDTSMPILLRDDNWDAVNMNDIKSLPVFSSKGMPVKVEQVTDGFDMDFDYNMIRRIDRRRCMMMLCEPMRGVGTSEAFNAVWQEVKRSVDVPSGYEMKYYGEQETQDRSNAALGKYVPLTFLIIYAVLLLLFPNYYRKPFLILAMLPLIFIGVAWGLILFGRSLDFFAILGLLGLIGMNVKNAIVLVDEIDSRLRGGTASVQAVVHAAVTRVVPVTMASGTTILGMIPLLSDAMFAGMAATIMGGLFVSTLLTLLVLPVTYCLFFHLSTTPS